MRNARIVFGLFVLASVAVFVANAESPAAVDEGDYLAQCGGYGALQASPYYGSTCAATQAAYGSSCNGGGYSSYGSSCNGGAQSYYPPPQMAPMSYGSPYGYAAPVQRTYPTSYAAPTYNNYQAYQSPPRLVCGPNGCYYVQ